jgi:hypothetical protein
MTSAPSTSWREDVRADETARFDALAAVLRGIQRKAAERAPKGRAAHYKGHGGLRAKLRTHGDIPDWAKVGIFATQSEHDAYVRFSNGTTHWQKDKAPDVRGMAVKVLGVPGKKLIPGMEDETTQDFLAILSSSVAFRSPEEFVGLIRAATGSPLLALPRLIGAFGLFRLPGVLSKSLKSLSKKVDSLAAETFYSALPIRWGDYAVKFSLAPKDFAASDPGDASDGDRLRHELDRRLASAPVRFELRIQAYVDDVSTPIEDATVDWDVASSPWITVADLEIVQQDTTSDQGKKLADWIETLSFDPWHAPVEFRPLGALMRARSNAYRESTIERGAAKEPKGDAGGPS